MASVSTNADDLNIQALTNAVTMLTEALSQTATTFDQVQAEPADDQPAKYGISSYYYYYWCGDQSIC